MGLYVEQLKILTIRVFTFSKVHKTISHVVSVRGGGGFCAEKGYEIYKDLERTSTA